MNHHELILIREHSLGNADFNRSDLLSTAQQAISQANNFCCFVDASWSSPSHEVRVAWVLFNKNGKQMLTAS